MENIVVSISHGFQVRNFVQTLFMRTLMKSYNVLLVVNENDKSYLEGFLIRLHLEKVKVVGVQIKEKKYEGFFMLLRKNIFVNPKRVQTRNILNEINNTTLGTWKRPLSLANYVLGAFELTRALWRAFEGFFIRGNEFDFLFKKYNPVKVVTADYGTRAFEIRLLRSAKRHKVKSIAIVPSWDNLTSKGVMGIKPNYLAVWNEIMVEEAIELHTFKGRNIFVTGPLQFDNFFDPSFKMDSKAFCDRFQVNPGQPVIVYGTITPKYFKYNLEVLDLLRRFIENGTIKGNPKVIVRIHPQVVKDPILGDNLDAYKRLVDTSSIFHLSLPEIEDWATMQVPMESDFKELISILTYAQICIASASTLIFDSFACNTCFIGVGFDGFEKLPKHKSVRRMFEFEHYKNVYAIGGFKIAETKEELADFINEYLSDPSIHKEKREQTLIQQIKFLDGRNYLRVLEAINRI